MDLTEDLDDAIGRGPAPPPLARTVAAGRRALLVRRLATAGAALGVAVVVAATAALLVPGAPAADLAPDPAAPPSAPPSVDRPAKDPGTPATDRRRPAGSRAAQPEGRRLGREPGTGVRVTPDGRLVALDGARILERVENPLDRPPPGSSWAASVRREDGVEWYLVDRTPGTRSLTSWGPWGSYASFTAWVDDQVRLARAGRDAG